MAFLTVGALYRYVPRRRPQWKEALIGSLTFSLLWVAAKLMFVTYNEYATVYTKLYGSLLEVILLLLWIYYSALLFLFGAELAHALQQRTQAAVGTFSHTDIVPPSATAHR
jgi:membrane protein